MAVRFIQLNQILTLKMFRLSWEIPPFILNNTKLFRWLRKILLLHLKNKKIIYMVIKKYLYIDTTYWKKKKSWDGQEKFPYLIYASTDWSRRERKCVPSQLAPITKDLEVYRSILLVCTVLKSRISNSLN